jgi:hypothetical protein
MPNFQGAHRNTGTTTQRGYGSKHQKERARWKPVVDAGRAWCRQPVCLHRSRWIPPGSDWALGHNDTRDAYLGPCHADCNQRDGARRGALIGNTRQGARSHRTHHWTSAAKQTTQPADDPGPGPGW